MKADTILRTKETSEIQRHVEKNTTLRLESIEINDDLSVKWIFYNSSSLCNTGFILIMTVEQDGKTIRNADIFVEVETKIENIDTSCFSNNEHVMITKWQISKSIIDEVYIARLNISNIYEIMKNKNVTLYNMVITFLRLVDKKAIKTLNRFFICPHKGRDDEYIKCIKYTPLVEKVFEKSDYEKVMIETLGYCEY